MARMTKQERDMMRVESEAEDAVLFISNGDAPPTEIITFEVHGSYTVDLIRERAREHVHDAGEGATGTLCWSRLRRDSRRGVEPTIILGEEMIA